MKQSEFEAKFIGTEINSNLSLGYPIGKQYFYACKLCSEVLPSATVHGEACSCRNLVIDADAGRVAVRKGSESVAALMATSRTQG